MIENFYYGEFLRLDWGLGNPNKTAALLVQLLILIWGLSSVKKIGVYISTLMFVLLGGCLLHTFSRGGIVAALVGLFPLLVCSYRILIKKYFLLAVVAGILLFGYASYLDVFQRYGQGIVKEDRSITNRLDIWRKVPAMVVAAPTGWGYGQAGLAYMAWFQDTQRAERYRTLVNSHLTRFVEFGWIFIFLYVFTWGTIIMLCLPLEKQVCFAIPLGVWLSFAVSAFFSTIDECLWVWPLPITLLGIVVYFRYLRKKWPSYNHWLFVIISSLLICIVFYGIGIGHSNIYYDGDKLILGKKPQVWIVYHESTMGKYEYARNLREFYYHRPDIGSVGIIFSIDDLVSSVSSADTLVISCLNVKNYKKIFSCNKLQIKRLILISPEFSWREIAEDVPKDLKLTVYWGERSESPYKFSWASFPVKTIKSVADFYPNLPEIIWPTPLSK